MVVGFNSVAQESISVSDTSSSTSENFSSSKAANPTVPAVSESQQQASFSQELVNDNSERNSFRSLEEETELLLQEILNLSSDLTIVGEEDDGSQLHQVTVLVTSDPTKLFDLGYIELKIDKQTVAAYQYTDEDVNAIKLGGGHRLYMTNLSPGIHKVSAFMLGSVPRDPDYKREVTYYFIAGISSTVIELNIDSKNNTTYPNLVAKEWN